MAKVARPLSPPLRPAGNVAEIFQKRFPANTLLCYSAAQQQLGATAPWHHERSHQDEEHDDVSQQLVVA
ncbi:hypothetical protein ACTQ40_01385 [Collinsella sp. Sow4_D11]|uniref:hypothetical protein n=1 Tax=Collinsella sp. Sow4_D11 TaxID=3438775 RepID=UPI003F8F23DE